MLFLRIYVAIHMGGRRVLGDWAVLNETEYREILMEVAVRSGLYDWLRDGVLESAFYAWQSEAMTRVVEALCQVGLVNYLPGTGYRWMGETPNPQVIFKWDQVRRWLSLAKRVNSNSLSVDDWNQAAHTLRLQSTAQSLVEWLIDIINPAPGSLWLDIGGGSDIWAQRLCQAGARAVVAEKPEVAAGIAEHPGVSCWAGDVFSNLPQGPFDGVTMIRFIDDWEPGMISALLTRVEKITKPNSRIFIVGYFMDRARYGALFDVNVMLNTDKGRCYKVQDLLDEAERAGYRRVSEHQADFDSYTAMGLQALGSQIFAM